MYTSNSCASSCATAASSLDSCPAVHGVTSTNRPLLLLLVSLAFDATADVGSVGAAVRASEGSCAGCSSSASTAVHLS
jgi:hypothetical protein